MSSPSGRRQVSARVVVVGLGPAGPELMTGPAREAVARVSRRFVRTVHHPAATGVGPAASFDALYQSAQTREEVYGGIVEAVVAAAVEHGEVLYAVPGSPLVGEASVALLAADDRVEVELVPGLSFLDLAWARLGVDPLTAGVRLVDGEAFALEAAGERGPLLVAQCWSRQVLSDIKLAVEEEPPGPVTVLARLGLPNEAVLSLPWADLDRAVEPDHLTTLFIPSLAAPVGVELARLGELVRTLRRRCPWDREQTHGSLTRHLLEETYEVLEAIEGLGPGGAGYADLEEELGDLLFQVYFHSTLAAEAGQFNLADVARGVHDKLVGRHPHVFGSVVADSADRVVANWERIKRAEKGRASIMDGIPTTLPALLAASKVLGKAVTAGADRRSLAQAGQDLEASAASLARLAGAGERRSAPAPSSLGRAGSGGDEVGALLLAAAGVARRLGVDAEAALRRATAGYRRRFTRLEELAGAGGGPPLQEELGALGDDQLSALWDQTAPR